MIFSAYTTATTIIQSNTGVGCSSVCIDGNCINSCDDSVTINDNVIIGEGEITSKSVALQDFSVVKIESVDTIINQADRFAIKVFGHGNVIERVNLTQKGHVLTVGISAGQYIDANYRVEISMPALARVELIGDGEVAINKFTEESLSVLLHGTGRFKGAANKIAHLDLQCDGAGEVDLLDSLLTDAQLTVYGTCTAGLHFSPDVATRIYGTIEGIAEINVCGQPQNDVAINGLADIQQVSCS